MEGIAAKLSFLSIQLCLDLRYQVHSVATIGKTDALNTTVSNTSSKMEDLCNKVTDCTPAGSEASNEAASVYRL